MGAYHVELMDALMEKHRNLRDECDANEDTPEVVRADAIAKVTACIAHEVPAAYGISTKDWIEHLWNELADNQGGVLLVLMIGASIPSVADFLEKPLGDCIEGLANRQLAQMSAEELEACL